MFMLRLVILLGGVLVIAFAVSQVFIPIWRGTPLFPFFRRRGKLRRELAHAREDLGDADLELEAGRLRAQAEKIRHPKEEPVDGGETPHSDEANDNPGLGS